MADTVIIKPPIREKFAQFMKQGRVFFISAPCGFGKTTLAQALLAPYKVLSLSGSDGTLSLPKNLRGYQVMFIDDMQELQEEMYWKQLLEFIQDCPEGRFVLSSRGALPGVMMTLLFNGLLFRISADDLIFDRDTIQQALSAHGVILTKEELERVEQLSGGVPAGVALLGRIMPPGSSLTQQIIATAFQEIYRYYEASVFQRFDLPIRRFLLELTPFDNFDATMARMVTGNPRAAELLDWLLTYTTMLRFDNVSHYYFWPQFRAFLQWVVDKSVSQEKRNTILIRGGMYYEMNEDYSHALQCYTQAGDHGRVSEILIRNADRHPGQGFYREMEKYYRSLPKAEILASPALMQGMSMLEALDQNYDISDRWYGELKSYAHRCNPQDAAGKEARSRLAWLDISLPHRDV